MFDFSAESDRYFSFADWTTIAVPQSCAIEDLTTADGQRWDDCIRPFLREKQPGLFSAVWGRVLESPETVLLVSGSSPVLSLPFKFRSCIHSHSSRLVWETPSALAQWRTSAAYAAHAACIASFEGESGIKATERVRLNTYISRILRQPIALVDVYFPYPMTVTTQRAVEAQIQRRARPYSSRPSYGWLLDDSREDGASGEAAVAEGVVDFEGQQALRWRCLYPWRDLQAEEDFKRRAAKWTTDGEPPTVGVWPQWQRRMRDLGMLGIVVRPEQRGSVGVRSPSLAIRKFEFVMSTPCPQTAFDASTFVVRGCYIERLPMHRGRALSHLLLSSQHFLSSSTSSICPAPASLMLQEL